MGQQFTTTTSNDGESKAISVTACRHRVRHLHKKFYALFQDVPCNGISGLSQATIWNGTVPTVLGALGASPSYATAINNLGEVAGYSSTSSGNCCTDAFVWNGGSLISLGSGIAFGINDAGVVVGDSSGGATVWIGTVPFNLNTLLDSSGLGWQLVEALGL
jgi:probable HAF family extracellular repeat protein